MKKEGLLLLVYFFIHSSSLSLEFSKWAHTHNKNYPSFEEQKFREKIFEENSRKIRMWNEEKTYGGATFEINKFSDLTSAEFKAMYANCFKSSRNHKNPEIISKRDTSDIPASIDWRTKGAVTHVKDQGQCGSCWSFGATGTLEGAHFISTKKLVELSEQNLVDCSQAEYNDGCDGGRVDWAIQYVIDNKGIDTEQSYPYTAQDGTCQYNPSNNAATATGWNQTAQGDENDLARAVANIGPIGVAISVDDAFANYQSGVFIDNNCPNSPDQLDHAVLVVGYGTDPTQGDYWIVKNSWGASWGDHGYIKMGRNQNNMCGIATDAVYPIGVQ